MTARVVTKATTVTTDGVTTTLQPGTTVNVTPGSPLETAIGTSNLVAQNPNQTNQGQGGPGTSNRG
jgi:hypothetical protein